VSVVSCGVTSGAVSESVSCAARVHASHSLICVRRSSPTRPPATRDERDTGESSVSRERPDARMSEGLRVRHSARGRRGVAARGDTGRLEWLSRNRSTSTRRACCVQHRTVWGSVVPGRAIRCVCQRTYHRTEDSHQ
jgi:hypothetical protein